ncbi:DHHW family protein [Hornefia butyriciproducens]|uniref:DHHW family protein n=1 Tax=Hornefia butyriciproducens TaxID=2652293 RepID=UPI003F8B7FC0
MRNSSYTRITGLLFVVCLAAVFLLNLILPDKTFSAVENRVLQTLPSFSVSKYMEGRYETKLENYVNDQFLLRNGFIRIKSAADVTEGKLEANGVYRYRDHYLMEEISTPNKHFVYTKNALRQFSRQYSNVKMYFLLAPNAANILSDKLPATVRMADQNRYMDSFLSDLHSFGYTTIDIRDAFRKAKEDTQLYYRTDHHWTSDGAYLAYRTAAKKMKLDNKTTYDGYAVKNDFRGTLCSKSGFVNGRDDAIKIYLPDSRQNYRNSVIYYADTKKKTTHFYQLDNLKKKDAYTVFGGSNHPMYTIQTPGTANRTLLLIKDSYANSFIPFLSQNYRRIIVVDPRYFFEDIGDLIDAYKVDEILFLYNANTFFQDDSLEMMLSD